MSLTAEQHSKCVPITHSAAVVADAGNLLPAPGAGLAADVMTAMTIHLASALGGNLADEAARGMALAAIKHTLRKQPLRTLTKGISKALPLIGPVVAPAMSVTLLEAAGWSIARSWHKAIAWPSRRHEGRIVWPVDFGQSVQAFTSMRLAVRPSFSEVEKP